MRRSFSGLFGRFFARAYLEIHHEFVWFAAIDGNNFSLSPHWRVKRKRGALTEMPDWICARPGELAIGEAKGSHLKGNSIPHVKPGPIRTAEGQIGGVRVQKRVQIAGQIKWRSKKVKGWAVMSRWGLASPPRPPFLYVLDPSTEGRDPTPKEVQQLVQAVARKHVEQTAIGLGLLALGDQVGMKTQPRRVRLKYDQQKRVFLGAVITPFGRLDIGTEQAAEMSKLLPDPGLIRFVGLDENVFDSFLQDQSLQARPRERVDALTLIGRDGLVVAPLSQIVEDGIYAIDK
jgi:hypothetical protein